MAESIFRGTTICAVRKNGECAMAGDGQVTMGQQTVMKAHAHKVRRIYNGKVVVGFAGSVADAFALSEKFEEKLTQFSGNLPRAAVELAQDWRMDKAMRKLEAMLLCADKDNLLLGQRHGRGHRTGRRRSDHRLGRQLRAGRGAGAYAEHRPARAGDRRARLEDRRGHLHLYQRQHHRRNRIKEN